MAVVRLALDWTPNTNHTGRQAQLTVQQALLSLRLSKVLLAGFYVAQSKGWYAAENLNLEIVSPHTSNYKDTPVSLLTQDQVEFAIAPSESVVSAHTLQSAADKPQIQVKKLQPFINLQGPAPLSCTQALALQCTQTGIVPDTSALKGHAILRS